MKYNPIIVALDVNQSRALDDLVEDLDPHVGLFKIGLEATTAIGIPRALGGMHGWTGRRVMLDLKLHDIPNTMVKAMQAAAAYWPVWGVTVHVSAGRKALKQVAVVAKDHGIKCIAVTVLTSHDNIECGRIFNNRLPDTMHRFIRDADEAGCDAIVCAPTEARSVRLNLDRPDDVTIICPGVRSAWAQKDDQARVMTPKEAITAGADYLVIGRPITQAEHPHRAAKSILEELDDGT